MNKTELIEHIATNADISKAAAARALESTIEAVKKTLKKGGTVSLVGFGTFAVGKRAARTGRNPQHHYRHYCCAVCSDGRCHSYRSQKHQGQ